jgi:ABC-2 type transport system ATP-binding protein
MTSATFGPAPAPAPAPETTAPAATATAAGPQPAVNAPLSVHQVSKRFGKPWKRSRWALDNVDLEIPEGSVTALVGPNGAGKTTLIRICMAFEQANSGHVEVAGVDPRRDRARALRSIGYVSQNPAVFRGLSVEDHLVMARTLHNTFDMAYARSRLEQLGIPLDQRADTLSGGQAAQLGLAIALGTRANLLLLDEPLASLDPLARREFIHVLLEAVRADGASALLSSHIVTDVEEACDRITILGSGKILLDSALTSALHGHVLTEGDAEAADAEKVGSYPGRHGKKVTLWRTTTVAQSTTSVERPAGDDSTAGLPSLEDVVLGYLAAGRGNAGLKLD